MEKNANYWIEKLGLLPHPEGGTYRRTYECRETVRRESPGSGPAVFRAASTAIVYLLEPGDFSALHRIRSDEMWHFYAGGPVALHCIDPDGNHSSVRLGKDPDAGEVFQAVVPAGTWFGAVPTAPYSLVGCTVSPGFDFDDFELADRETLLREYPRHREIILRLTR